MFSKAALNYYHYTKQVCESWHSFWMKLNKYPYMIKLCVFRFTCGFVIYFGWLVDLWLIPDVTHKLRLHGTWQAVRPRRDRRAAKQNRNIGIKNASVLKLNCHAALAVPSSIVWRTPTSEIADTCIICVAQDSYLPCKRYCRAASRTAARFAACRIPCKRTHSLCDGSFLLHVG